MRLFLPEVNTKPSCLNETGDALNFKKTACTPAFTTKQRFENQTAKNRLHEIDRPTLKNIWAVVPPVPVESDVYDVFDMFAKNLDWPFLPVVNELNQPLGIIREHDLKCYAYSRFGRELVKRQSLKDLIRPCMTLPCDTNPENLLNAVAGNKNIDGVILTRNGIYISVLFNLTLIHLFSQHHMETQVRMAQLQKMEAIGTLAGGIAHDLNNMLTPVIGFAGLIKESIQQNLPLDIDMVDDIITSAQRARETVKRILSFSRQQETEHRPLNIASSAKEALRIIRSSLPKTVDIEFDVEHENAYILADSTEIHQVIMNLCTNAFHAMNKKNGTISITLTKHTGPFFGWSICPDPAPGIYIRLSVCDTGSGIPRHAMSKIFDPFFTTKPQGEGTGMGLSVVHGIISKCNGYISVESTPGVGSKFHVYFPLIKTEIGACQTVKTENRQPFLKPNEPQASVFVVDDEAYITRLAGASLSRHGIRVDCENDSVRAFHKIKANPGFFDVLVVDQMMPEMSGIELVERVLKLRADLPVIMCTGYSEGITPTEARKRGVREFVLKPVDFSQIASWIKTWTNEKIQRADAAAAEILLN